MPILIEQDFNTMRADIEHLKLKINTIKQELKKLRSKLLRKRVEKNRPFLTKSKRCCLLYYRRDSRDNAFYYFHKDQFLKIIKKIMFSQ